jgi:hypothetical protein
MQPPVILWDNLFRKGVLTASTYLTGSYVQNVIDYRTHTFWQGGGASTYTITVDLSTGAALPADAIGIAAHNLYSIGSTIIIQSSTDGTSWVSRSTFSCTSDDPHISTFASATAPYWRCVINCPSSESPRIGILNLSTLLNFPRCPTIGGAPPYQTIQAVSNLSQTGILLGNVIRCHPEECNINLAYIPTTFFMSTSGPANYGQFWVQHGRYLRPFFFGYSPDTFPEHNRYMRLRENSNYQLPLEESTLVQSFAMGLISCLEATT